MPCSQPIDAPHGVMPAHAAPAVPGVDDALRLGAFVQAHERLFVLTGAGCSTVSGIPDYRDAAGVWKAAKPMQHQAFVASAANRRRYWARSMAGWPAVARAAPNAAHKALARLQRRRRLAGLVTQNVDGLHAAAGSRGVINLHGKLDRVLCLACDAVYTRRFVQTLLADANPCRAVDDPTLRPDGDVELDVVDYRDFRVPDCPACGGTLKPDVVFFGGTVPKPVAARAWRRLADADAVLVVGSSLMVWSGFRFVREASRRRLPIAVVNRGRTRADAWIDRKFDADCVELLPQAMTGI